MKILHALVCYLAFHPFAFASPLTTMDYDGYVNSTTQKPIDSALMGHVLAGIVQACQSDAYHGDYANTTRNRRDSDNALMKRMPGDIVEARFAELVPTALIIIGIVVAVTLSIIWIESDDPKREAFTQDTISNAISQYPKWNWVICHSPYSIGFDGTEGTDYGYTHHELKISWGRTIGYDLYWARSGTFYRYGDGGFINWAYNGNIQWSSGGTVNFGAIS